MKAAVIVFPGSNCDEDCRWALQHVCGVPTEMVWFRHRVPDDVDLIVLPGGFSYGDYLRAGALARFAPAMESVREAAEKGRLVLGICNGFQILVEAHLLPGVLLRNTCLQFLCKDVFLKTVRRDTPFTLGVPEVVRMPIAHGMGNYYIDTDGLKALQDNGQIVFQYCDHAGRVTAESNPNGSLDNIAGIVNRAGNVLGMMPHPERAAEDALGCHDGRYLLESAIRYLIKG
ncbi:MAG: phosphoribosylformylglycinamidine synthase subunit PurQ [Candidatus Sumerlaeia bacterium]|nr:phosphoribosylformylglycinamidine synthase subunit PurQ [Candidatus Sumerlaeia bacterium]